MEQIGVVGETIISRKIGIQKSNPKMNNKNLSSWRWNGKSENGWKNGNQKIFGQKWYKIFQIRKSMKKIGIINNNILRRKSGLKNFSQKILKKLK